MNGKIKLLLVCFGLLLFLSCHKEENGKMEINFSFLYEGKPFVADQLIYTNAAGNLFEMNDIQFFITDIKLNREDGSYYLINDNNSIHYVDYDIESTLKWLISDDIPAGNYSSLSFTFGFSPEKNISNYFVNPPENAMFWPTTLGGGYHYMKINCKWLANADSNLVQSFNFHTGKGQIRDQSGNITEYVNNQFDITVPNSSFTIDKGKTSFNLVMNLEKWFTSPHNFDFREWGTCIMQNQEAQIIVKENGWDVFSCKP